MLKKFINFSKEDLVLELWKSNPEIKQLLESAKNLHQARELFFDYLNKLERQYFNIYSDSYFKYLHNQEKHIAKECIRILKNIIRTENEKLTQFSALRCLFNIAKKNKTSLENTTEGFLFEFIFLFKGINGESEIYLKESELLEINQTKQNAKVRSKYLDKYSSHQTKIFKKYKTGLDFIIIENRKKLKNEIINFFGADESDWINYKWHLKHIINDLKILSSLVKLESDEFKALHFAEKNNINFQITPYYLSLFNKNGRTKHDRCIRAQVLPTIQYCKNILLNREKGIDMDFMGEKSTSPVDCITRRYPSIVILKLYDSCPQICVYCQRNWEIKNIKEAKITKDKIKKAIEWIKNNKNISEVLITGGDPLTLSDQYIQWILDCISNINHVERIRIGTRTLVTLPFRFNKSLLKILKTYHELGKREICIMTHFEHPTEITPDVLKITKMIKKAGINIYNQQVFTYYNSKRHETAMLRKYLKLCGIDPYYTFNTKGKEETIDFRVPISRIEQERKEEARLLPGIIRNDEPVFNVPKLGKSNLRAWQDHEPIMILKDGKRVYRFYPWESMISLVSDYLYVDVSIYDYLKRLYNDGENIDNYESIWYYF